MGCSNSKGAETGATKGSAPQDKTNEQAPADSTQKSSEPAQQQDAPASDPVPE